MFKWIPFSADDSMFCLPQKGEELRSAESGRLRVGGHRGAQKGVQPLLYGFWGCVYVMYVFGSLGLH